MQKDDDLCLEFDFKERKIAFLCRNAKCKHMNEFDIGGWNQEQERSPLPPTRLV